MRSPAVLRTGGPSERASVVSFDRKELDAILRVYGQQVARGEWRDYAIDHLEKCAVFSIFRHASEAPLYRVEKHPHLSQRQGAYLIAGMNGQTLKRGHDLAKALRVLEPKSLRLID